MTLTMIKASSAFDREILAEHSELILASLSDVCDADLMSNVAVVYAPGPRQSDGSRSLSSFHRDLDTLISKGISVVALVEGVDDLSDAASLMSQVEMDFSPVTGTIISEVMRVTTQAPSRRLSDLLSSRDKQIAALPSSLVLGALRQKAPGAAVHTIMTAVEKHTREFDGQSLEGLHLPPELRCHLGGILTDIADYQDGKTGWSDVSVSTLLHGPPGCGKTSIAQALAVSARLHFVSASFSDCQSAGNLSDFLKALEDRVSEAIAHAPSLIFMDELDSYMSRTENHGHNNSYMQLVVNALLQVLSRLNNTPGVLVVAATNHANMIDAAILRAGRFDHHVYVGPPSPAGVAEILRKRLGSHARGIDIGKIVVSLTGMSGADVSTVATKALGAARRSRRPVQLSDLKNEVDRLVPASFANSIWRIAVHEAGHAVARVSLGMPKPTRALLSPNSSFVEGEIPSLLRSDDVTAMIAVFLAGRAAEKRVFGDVSSGAESDLRQATELALFAECRAGLTSDHSLHLSYSIDRSEAWPAHIHKSLSTMMEKASKLANRAVEQNLVTVLAFAKALQIERELTGDRLSELLSTVTVIARHSDAPLAISKGASAKQAECPRDTPQHRS
ncbi:AAA family ATPase [uncultured Pelagimonas sp.]|uniref:AAA family ATPase n=1 Tax=uncultured Pelagimonas sp. TaxID=1618102 RepID=UPI0026379A0B|nr:AAA family ATPase [uncultured Pelagimonas sp.]